METKRLDPVNYGHLRWNFAQKAFFLLFTLIAFSITPRVFSQELERVYSSPDFGTFYSVQITNAPPLPFNPFPELDLYSWGSSIFYYDDAEVDYVSLNAMRSDQPPPPPPPGGEGGGGSDTNSFPAYNYTTNDLWLEIVSKTNLIGTFVIHTPVTNGAYDLFMTTNLSATVPGLNLTNWAWLYRTTPAETNLVLTNLVAVQGYFLLGTMLDTDGDGLTDAYEKLVTHTNPTLWDTDGDGMSDYAEIIFGTSPFVNESAFSGNRINYTYGADGLLQSAAGLRTETITVDAEGNVTVATP